MATRLELEPVTLLRHTAAKMNDERIHNAQGDAAVIGLGRFGTFWAQEISGQFRVCGTSRRTIPDLPPAVVQVPLAEALTRPVIFLAVSISAMPTVLDEIAPHIRRDATVVDTCSVKVWPVAQMEERLPASVDIVAMHPMFGPDSAAERSDELPVIAWPIRDRAGRYADIAARLRQCGMRIVEMTPDDHDREAAFTQGVTHLVGRLLDHMELSTSDIATLGYTRLLQVREQTCNDPLQLFLDLQRYNPYTRAMRERFADALATVTDQLSRPDEPTA